MTELPNPEVVELWEEKVKAWREVQSVLDWIHGDRDLYNVIMRIHRREVTVEEGVALFETTLTKRGEKAAACK